MVTGQKQPQEKHEAVHSHNFDVDSTASTAAALTIGGAVSHNRSNNSTSGHVLFPSLEIDRNLQSQSTTDNSSTTTTMRRRRRPTKCFRRKRRRKSKQVERRRRKERRRRCNRKSKHKKKRKHRKCTRKRRRNNNKKVKVTVEKVQGDVKNEVTTKAGENKETTIS